MDSATKTSVGRSDLKVQPMLMALSLPCTLRICNDTESIDTAVYIYRKWRVRKHKRIFRTLVALNLNHYAVRRFLRRNPHKY
jgi:hypothetical protein